MTPETEQLFATVRRSLSYGEGFAARHRARLVRDAHAHADDRLLGAEHLETQAVEDWAHETFEPVEYDLTEDVEF